MESIQQFELILMSKMDASPSQCSDTEELSFGDNFANGKTFKNGLKWEIKLILIFPVFRSIFEISWRLHRHWLLSRAWQGRENVHRWWVERVSRVRFYLEGGNWQILTIYHENRLPIDFIDSHSCLNSYTTSKLLIMIISNFIAINQRHLQSLEVCLSSAQLHCHSWFVI